MSKLGEKTDMILELANKETSLTIEKIKISAEDSYVLNFMQLVGLIELIDGKVVLTDFGAGIISAD